MSLEQHSYSDCPDAEVAALRLTPLEAATTNLMQILRSAEAEGVNGICGPAEGAARVRNVFLIPGQTDIRLISSWGVFVDQPKNGGALQFNMSLFVFLSRLPAADPIKVAVTELFRN